MGYLSQSTQPLLSAQSGPECGNQFPDVAPSGPPVDYLVGVMMKFGANLVWGKAV